MISRLGRFAHSPAYNVAAVVAFAIFNTVGYHYGGKAFVEEWGGSLAAVFSVAALIWKAQGYWFWQIVNASLWIALFFTSGLPILGYLQVSFMLFALYGMTQWALVKMRIGYDHHVVIDNIGTAVALCVFGYSIYAYRNMPGYTGTFWWGMEASTVFLSIVANWMDAFRYKFNWIIWSMTNVISWPLFAHNHLWGPFAFTFVYQAMNFVGYYHWYREEKKLRRVQHVTTLEEDFKPGFDGTVYGEGRAYSHEVL